jgi:regulator of cell morphogenesis and NO signaling
MRDDDMTVAELTTTRPASTRVLYRHGIEFCTGASRRLSDACSEGAVTVAAVLAEIEQEETGGAVAVAWARRPLAELVDHIVGAFHTVEQREMNHLHDLLADAGARRPAVVEQEELAAAFADLRSELTEHMAKEETVLFPWLRSGRGDLARTPIQVMMMEHEATLRLLNRVRALRQAFAAAAPLPAADIVDRLCALDRHVREHMHLENNVLFPRALRGEE